MKKVLLSGVKPTGRPHIGNYFGAMKQFVDLLNGGTEEYDCYFFIADYHALNFIQNKEEMRQNILDLAIDYLSIGLDPKRATLFKQSDVSAHTELSCIFDTIVTMPYLMRAHAYKDAEAKNKEINVGTFNYPVLMAADILLYDTDVVPVGQDQKQHVEYARDIAEKFNFTFCGATKDGKNSDNAVFKLPEALILENVAIVPGTDGRKMSKSYSNTIPLFATREEIQKVVMSIVTDSNGTDALGIPANVYAIHKLFKTEGELKILYDTNKGKYKVLKEALIEDIDNFIKPLRERRADLAKDTDKVLDILKDGAGRANKVASAKLEQVKQIIGVSSICNEVTHKGYKNYCDWMPLKFKVNNSDSVRANFHEREIWYCHLGENIGFEQDGKGEHFLRPVVIIRKFNNEVFWAVPLTSTIKNTKYYFQLNLNESKSSAILSQIRLTDAKRLSHKIGTLPKDEYIKLSTKHKELLP